MSKNRLGLVVGSFLALVHVVWSILVATIPASLQTFVDWVFEIHHIDMPFAIVTPFILMNAVYLIILTFILGYIFGWVLAWLFKMFGCRCKG